jgi:hypothetical protein
MFVPHRRHIPPRLVTGRALLFICRWCSYLTGNTCLDSLVRGGLYFLYVDDVRTSQETHASTVRYRDIFTIEVSVLALQTACILRALPLLVPNSETFVVVCKGFRHGINWSRLVKVMWRRTHVTSCVTVMYIHTHTHIYIYIYEKYFILWRWWSWWTAPDQPLLHPSPRLSFAFGRVPIPFSHRSTTVPLH